MNKEKQGRVDTLNEVDGEDEGVLRVFETKKINASRSRDVRGMDERPDIDHDLIPMSIDI